MTDNDSFNKLLAKVFKGKQFSGEFRKSIETIIDDSDWLFLIKTIRNELRDPMTMEPPYHYYVILILIAAQAERLDETYDYTKVKGILKQQFEAGPIFKSLKATQDRNYLRLRAVESLTSALGSPDGILLPDSWAVYLEVAAMALAVAQSIEMGLSNSKDAALSSKAKKRTRGKDPAEGGADA